MKAILLRDEQRVPTEKGQKNLKSLQKQKQKQQQKELHETNA